jgi:hypothetical protein
LFAVDVMPLDMKLGFNNFFLDDMHFVFVIATLRFMSVPFFFFPIRLWLNKVVFTNFSYFVQPLENDDI